MPYVVQVERLDSIPLAVIRRQVRPWELGRVVPECCGLVWNVLGAQQARGGRHVAIYWDNAVRVDVGAEVFGPFVERDEVVRGATPAGTIASTMHLGPYTGLGAAHRAVHEWCRAHSRRLAGPKWEIYGHWQPEWDTNPSHIRTDVYYLLDA